MPATGRRPALPLRWGQRYLMCPPTHFEVACAINSWMGGRVDADLAMSQWETLVATLRLAGATVDVVPPVSGLPDMVFTANAGIVDGTTFHAGAMRHPQRRPETARFIHWFTAQGLVVERLPAGAVLEGLGDCLPLGEGLVAGHGTRSTRSAHRHLTAVTGRPVISVRLTDPRWYHVDLTLCPLDDRHAIVYPDAYDPADASEVLATIPEPLVLDEGEASTFAANAVVVGRTVVMPACPRRVGIRLESWGFEVVVVAVGEFVKAGGAVRCLTLPLDTRLSPPSAAGSQSVEEVA